MRKSRTPLCLALGLVLAWIQAAAHAEEIKVLHPQGAAHGFVDVVTLEGKRIAVGDLLQSVRGSVVSSELVVHFFDGSLDDETTVYSQHETFRFLSDHHVQRGPSFPKPTDVTIDARKNLITSTDEAGHVTQTHFEMPPDTYNGLASTLLMNVPATAPETRIALVVAGEKPRLIHLSMKNVGEASITMGGVPRKATNFDVHVELGGVAGVVAPVIGKEPPDYHVLIMTGPYPAFIREEGPLYQGGPVWRMQQVSASFPDEPRGP
jgi:hypothetical protein